jgi:RNA polymerase sigma factor (sigma-70 family)
VDRAGDAALVAGLAVGDERAAAAFVRRFQSRVFGLAVSVTGDEWLAQDVAQETFAKAWRAASTYDPRRASVLTWLLTITRNAAIDAVRTRRPTPIEAEQMEALLSATLRAAGPEEYAVARSEQEVALAALRGMPPEQARAVVLAVVGGRTSAEISRHEGIPLGTAKTRIRTGMRRVRMSLEAEHD